MSKYAPIAQRVLAGALWLDLVRPNWRDLVDLHQLDITNPDDCVLGQVFHDEGREHANFGYSWACHVFGWDWVQSSDPQPQPHVALGFTALNWGEWDELQHLWSVAITS